jgi:subtilisin family serine protease
MIDLRHATGHGVRVAVVDSGVHAEHPHVGWTLRGFAVTGSGDRIRREDDARDVHGHGTACAAVIRWGAPDAAIVPVRVLDSGLAGHSDAVAFALALLLEEAPSVVNLSLGVVTTPSEALDAALHALIARGATIVASCRPGGGAGWPVGRDGVIAVGADAALTHWQYRVRRSGPAPHVTASPYPRPIPGRAVHENLAGASFAAPRVSALVARAREIRGAASVDQLLEILDANAEHFRGGAR